MIDVVRVTVAGVMSYENAQILQGEETKSVPNYFEDSNFVFKNKEGIFSLPYYNITLVHLNTIQRHVSEGVHIPLITISWQCPFKDVVLIPADCYAKYGVPVLFPIADQFAFQTKEGIFISSDYQVQLVMHHRR
jgi:hypothetical protein